MRSDFLNQFLVRLQTLLVVRENVFGRCIFSLKMVFFYLVTTNGVWHQLFLCEIQTINQTLITALSTAIRHRVSPEFIGSRNCVPMAFDRRYFQYAHFIPIVGRGKRDTHVDWSMVICKCSTRYWNYLEDYWPCAGGLSATNAIGTQLSDRINSGLARWLTAV